MHGTTLTTSGGQEIVFRSVYGFNGPLIFHDNAALQKEIDATSRKINKFILKRTG
jgi:hypothetical protein